MSSVVPTPVLDQARRKRRGVTVAGVSGAVAGDPTSLRTHCVSVRLAAAEMAWLDAARAKVGMARGEYLRCAAVGKLPREMPSIPELNREAWVALSRAATNLHQYARHLAVGDRPDLAAIRLSLTEFRLALVGAELRPDAEAEPNPVPPEPPAQ